MIVAGIAMAKMTPSPKVSCIFPPSPSAPKTSPAPSPANSFNLAMTTLAASNSPWPSGVLKRRPENNQANDQLQPHPPSHHPPWDLTAIRRHRPGQAKERDNPQETDEFECHNNGGKLLNSLIKRKPIGPPAGLNRLGLGQKDARAYCFVSPGHELNG